MISEGRSIPVFEVSDGGDEMSGQAESHCAHVLDSDGLLEDGEELLEFSFILWVCCVRMCATGGCVEAERVA
jgi:hypothetical protein